MYRDLLHRHRIHWTDSAARRASVLAILVFAASVVTSFFAITYATERASNAVTDVILSNTPAWNVSDFFAIGTLLLIAFITLLLLARPRCMPFSLYALALFFFVRSGFISLTHIGPFPVQTTDADWGKLLDHFLFSSDLFFSAHTGVPFLFALIFWREKSLRYIFLAWSAYMALVVLLGHYHYSIDVASAYFITYTVFHVAEWLFAPERELFLAETPRRV